MKKYKIKILDFYFNHPYLIDLILCLVTGWCFWKFRGLIRIPDDFTKLDAVISNIISSIVSLIGFILASLTIIVTVKSNANLKNRENAQNGMELLLSGVNYKLIVRVFRDAILELIFALFGLYAIWSPIFNLFKIKYILAIVLAILIIATTLMRALAVLFKIIFLEFKH